MKNADKQGKTKTRTLTKVELIVIIVVAVVLIGVLIPTVLSAIISSNKQSAITSAQLAVSSFVTENAKTELADNIVVFVAKDDDVYAYGYKQQNELIELSVNNPYKGYLDSGKSLSDAAAEIIAGNAEEFQMVYAKDGVLTELLKDYSATDDKNQVAIFSGTLINGVNTGKRPTYTITYVAEGAQSVPMECIAYAFGTHTVSSEIPIREGYTFVGWKDESIDESYCRGSYIQNITDNITLTAVWSEPVPSYTLIFEAEGGTITYARGFTNGKSLAAGTDISSIVANTTAKSSNGSEFLYWETEINGGKVVFDGSATSPMPITDNLVLRAVWKNDIEITFNAAADNVSNMPSTMTAQCGDVTLADTMPVRSGYRFFRWTTADNLAYKKGATLVCSNDTELTAQWQKETEFTVIYDGGADDVVGVDEAPQTIACVHSGTYNIRCAEPTREGYRFCGWVISLNKDRIGSDGLSFSYDESFVGETVCITAAWVKLYTVTYIVVKADSVKQYATEQYAAGEKVTTLDGSFKQENNSFIYWELHKKRADARISARHNVGTTFTMPPFDVYFTTCWAQNDRKIDYMPNSPTGDAAAVSNMPAAAEYAVTGKTYKTPMSEPVCDGYVFAGWVRADGAMLELHDGTSTASLASGVLYSVPDVDITLNATWEKCYKLTYASDKKAIGMPNDTKCILEGESVMISDITPKTESQQVFSAWNVFGKDGAPFEVDTNGDGTADSAQLFCGMTFIMPNSDIVLKAQYNDTVAVTLIVDNAVADAFYVEKGSSLLLPKHDGVTYWSTDVNGESKLYPGTEYEVGESICTLYGRLDNVTVQLNCDDATVNLPMSETVARGDTYAIPAIIPISSDTQKAFSHWTDGTNEFYPCDIITAAESIILTPVWVDGARTENTVKITYNDTVNKVKTSVDVALPITVGQNEFTLTNENLTRVLPGVHTVGDYSQTFSLVAGKLTPAEIEVDVYTVTEIDGEEYVNICSYDGLCSIDANPNGRYVLTNNIDLNGTKSLQPLCETKSDITGRAGFYGVLDGNGYEIRNYCSMNPDGIKIGLIAENYGTIRNLTLTVKQITAKYIAGGICGINYGTIDDCRVSVLTGGAVATNDNVRLSGRMMELCGSMTGGICGMNFGTVTCASFFGNLDNLYSPARIEVTDVGAFGIIGGIAGVSFGDIDRCHAFMTAMPTRYAQKKSGLSWSYVGGLVGVCCEGTVSNSWARAGLIGFRYVGGLVGYCCNGTIEDSWSSMRGYSITRGQSDYFGMCIGLKSISTSVRLSGMIYESNSSAGGIGTWYESLRGIDLFGNDEQIWKYTQDGRPQIVGNESSLADAVG